MNFSPTAGECGARTMAMSEAVIDSSVLLAILLQESGSEVAITLSAGASISAVNLAEVASRIVDKGAAPEIVGNAVEALSIVVASFGGDDALTAGALRNETRQVGLSLGDRACLALARRLGAIVYTADRRWAELDLCLRIELIR